MQAEWLYLRTEGVGKQHYPRGTAEVAMLLSDALTSVE